MKKIIIRSVFGALGALLCTVLAPTSAQAAVTWNTFANDCANVVVIANATTQANVGNAGGCWGTSVSATPGQTINVRIDYHNTSAEDAPNTIVHLSNPTGLTATNFNFTGFVSSGASQRYNQTPVSAVFTSAQKVTFGSAYWYKDKSLNGVYLANGSDILSGGGLNLGTIKSALDCQTAGIPTDCHRGSVVVSFIVSSAAVTPTCTINSFGTTTGATSVTSGTAATLTWNTTGCDYVQISGNAINTQANASGTLPLGAQYQTTTFTLTGHQTTSTVAPSRAFTLTVASAQVACAISSFAPDQSSVAQYGSTMLRWSASSGCNNFVLSGGMFSNTPVSGGAISTGSLSNLATYTLTASGTNTTTAVTTVTVASVTPTCVITSFNPTTTSVVSGGSTMLAWTTNGCTSVTLSGGIYSGSSFGSNFSVTTGALTNTTPYTLTASGPNTATASTLVNITTVAPTCIVSGLSASSPNIVSGTGTTLYWSMTGCTNLYLSGGMFSNTPVSGTSIGTGILNTTTLYTLTGGGPNTSTQSTTVTVTNTQNYCSVNISASQVNVISGGYTTISWSSTGCTTVNVSGNGLNSSTFSGSQSIGPIYGSYVYTISGTGSNTANQTVMVYAGGTPTPQTSLYVTTYAATNLSDTAATLNGYLNTGTSGSYNNNVTEYFQYGTDQNSLYNQTTSQYVTSNTTMYAYVSGLAPNTTYYFRAVGYGSYGTVYGNILSFVTNGQGSYGTITAITSLPTNISTYSARVNGLVTGVSNQTSVQVYFEYGTSNALGMQTSVLTLNGTSANNNYYDTITTSPNTTYYYRIVALVGGQTYYGSTTSFTSLPFSNDSGLTDTTTNNTNTVIYHVSSGSGSDLVTLTINDNADSVRPGDTVTYIVNYQNISSSTLSDVVLSVILPAGVTFRQSSAGVYGANNTVTDALGTLVSKQQGVVSVTGVIDQSVSPTNTFMATATMVYTKPSKVQGSAIAYDIDSIGGNNLFGAAAFFGWGGGWYWWYWILFLLILIVLVLIARYYYHHGNVAKRDSQAPVAPHTYYAAPAQTHQYDSHTDDHLPH